MTILSHIDVSSRKSCSSGSFNFVDMAVFLMYVVT